MHFDPKSKTYYHISTGEPYIALKHPSKLKALQEKLEGYEANYAPIYYNKESGRFYYPASATEEETLLTRNIITGRPVLYFDSVSKFQYDVLSGEAYIQTFSPTEFKSIRQDRLMKMKRKEMEEVAEKTPIYFDNVTQKYYYPKGALSEMDEVARQIVAGKPALVYNSSSGVYFDQEHVPYLSFSSPEKFQALRRTTPKVSTGKHAQCSII